MYGQDRRQLTRRARNQTRNGTNNPESFAAFEAFTLWLCCECQRMQQYLDDTCNACDHRKCPFCDREVVVDMERRTRRGVPEREEISSYILEPPENEAPIPPVAPANQGAGRRTALPTICPNDLMIQRQLRLNLSGLEAGPSLPSLDTTRSATTADTQDSVAVTRQTESDDTPWPEVVEPSAVALSQSHDSYPRGRPLTYTEINYASYLNPYGAYDIGSNQAAFSPIASDDLWPWPISSDYPSLPEWAPSGGEASAGETVRYAQHNHLSPLSPVSSTALPSFPGPHTTRGASPAIVSSVHGPDFHEPGSNDRHSIHQDEDIDDEQPSFTEIVSPKSLACPFRQAFPLIHHCTNHLSRIRDVKQHVRRKHKGRGDELDITYRQDLQLNQYVTRSADIVDQYGEIWDILFPGKPPPCSIYLDIHGPKCEFAGQPCIDSYCFLPRTARNHAHHATTLAHRPQLQPLRSYHQVPEIGAESVQYITAGAASGYSGYVARRDEDRQQTTACQHGWW